MPSTTDDRIVYVDNEDGVLAFSIAPPGQPRADYVCVRGFTGAQARHANAVELLMSEHDALALQELLKKLEPATVRDPLLGEVSPEHAREFYAKMKGGR